MRTALWAGLLAIAAVWPSRLAGALDGAPLDTALDAALIGVALPVALWLAPGIFKQRSSRALIVALLAWKAFTSSVLVQDGWCLRFESPVAIFVDDLRVPHAWDVRADWRSHPPRCSAIMTRGYAEPLQFPTWFYNLPPSVLTQPARNEERPPNVTVAIDLHGYLTAANAGQFSVSAGDGVAFSAATIDGNPLDPASLRQGVAVGAGAHEIAIAGTMSGDKWSLEPKWNGADLWASREATVQPPSAIDRWLRPWASSITPILLLLLLVQALAVIATRAGAVAVAWVAGASSAGIGLALLGPGAAIRLAPVLLAGALLLPLPNRLRNMWGALLLIGVPFLAMLVALHAGEAGIFTWYPIGDDFWMFQRFAYRIYLQGYWLEAGEPAFWFQPFYRWIAGALHLVFGDSSVGELFWDGYCAVVGAAFAFAIVRSIAGFRWGVAAMTLVLLTMTAGPVWYLFGRGLSEISSMGFLSAAALLALRGRARPGAVSLAGVSATLAFFTRLNNLPMAAAVAAFAWPLRQPAGTVWSWRSLSRGLSWRSAIVIAAILGLGLTLFSARTWYYTGEFSLLYGTQGSARSVWQPSGDGQTPLMNALTSLMIVITMTDPPRFDPRALPIAAGVIAALLALLRIRPFDRLPLNAVLMCLAGVAGSLVARGSAYPGRFSTHMIPVTVALSIAAVALIVRRARAARRIT